MSYTSNTMKAATLVYIALVFWAQESHQQTQGEQALETFGEKFTFDVIPPKKDEALSENKTSSGEDLNVTANAVPGYDDFWNDKMIQAINQVSEVLTYTIPDFQIKINETYAIVERMKKLNADRLEDAQIVFSESTKPYRIALEMCVNVKNLPIYNNTYDYTKRWVDDALNETALQLPIILNGTEKLQYEAQLALDFLRNTLKGFTADKLRRSCYPNVRCATTQLSKLKDLIFEKRDIIIRCLNVFLGMSINLDSAMYVTISLMKNKISEESRAAGLELLDMNNITKVEVNNYFIRYHMSQNQYNLYVQSQLNKTLNCIYEYDYRNVRCKNMTKNAIMSSVYPVIDAYNTVNLLGRNRNGKVLGNEVVETREKIQNLSRVLTPLTPSFEKDIALFFDQANNFNSTIYERTNYYFTVTLATDFDGDLIKWYVFLDSKSRIIDLTFLDFVSKNLEHLLQNCTAKVMTSTLDFNKWLGGTLPAEIDQFHLNNLEPVGENLYNKGNITHKDIFYFGSVNLNASYRTWKPKLEEAITTVNKTYELIIKKNYNSYSIYQTLLEIVAQYVFTAFENTKGFFDSSLVARLNKTVLAQLVQIPSDEYIRLVRDSAVEVEKNFNKTFKYLPLNTFIRDELDAYLRKGIGSYSYHRSPRVEHSHVLSGKVYQMKVNYTQYIEQITYLKLDMESIDQGLDQYADKIKGKIKAVCEEYSALIQSYADAIAKGQPYVSTLPSSFQIFARYFREMHLTQDAEANPLAQIIDLSIFGF